LQLRMLAKECDTTLYTVLLSGWFLTLFGTCSQTDITIGTPVDNREHPQVQSLIGYFVNLLPLRMQLEVEQNVRYMIERLHTTVTEAKQHQSLPFEQIVNSLQLERDPSSHPLFQVLFSVQDFSLSENVMEQLPFASDDLLLGSDDYSPAHFDVSLFISDKQEQLKGHLVYAKSLFSAANMQRLIVRFEHVLSQMVSKPEQPLSTFQWLPPQEYQRLIFDWNQTDVDFGERVSIQQKFEQQVEKTPQHIAVMCDGKFLTYRELNWRVNVLARRIRHDYQQRNGHELQPDTFIGLYFDKSLDMIISMLAVLKSGAAYVPLSPAYPRERLSFIVNDTRMKLLLSHGDYPVGLNTWFDDGVSILAVDSELSESVTDTRNPEPVSTADDLAYVIYTSGTTGQPKGVMIEQHSVIN
ncbi:condensation domain-containing protein, partial [Aliikangiella sp. G2MR2-5]|uniref:condensation domain-containing protein n=1 Tax=Aliikangiella sp. G2MR2-5 TaxID=2788943 RepID=UPI0018AB47E4